MNAVNYRLALVLTEKIRELEWQDIGTVRWYVGQIKALIESDPDAWMLPWCSGVY